MKRLVMQGIISSAVLALAAPAAFAATVQVSGAGAPDTGSGPFSKLSLAVAYLQTQGAGPHVINVTTDVLTDDTALLISFPVTINGDGNSNSNPVVVTVDTAAILAAANTAPAGGRAYMYVQAEGDVVINDVVLIPTVNGSTTTVDAIKMYKPASGVGNYTMNRVVGTSANGDGEVADPESETDAYYVAGVRRWYAYLNDSGIIYLTDQGGAGSYNAVLNQCKAGAARSHNLNIKNQSGTTTINGGVYSYAGTYNIFVEGATGVQFVGTPAERVRVFRGNRSSGGGNIRLTGGAVVDAMSYVDIFSGAFQTTAYGLHVQSATITSADHIRSAFSYGQQMLLEGAGNVTFTNSTFHGGDGTDTTATPPETGNTVPLETAAGYTGTATFTSCIFTSDGGGVVTIGGGTVTFNTSYLSGLSGTATNNNPIVSAAPLYMETAFDRVDPANQDFLRPTSPYPITGGAGDLTSIMEWGLY